jgi:hypothetical protein
MIYEILIQSWIVLLESAPYMLLGFFAAGLIKAFLPDDFITRHLGAGKRGAVVKAAIVGAPIPLCSCGVVPTAAGIKRQGATNGATASFLIATPETGIDSVAVTWSLTDPLMTLLRPLSAVVTAIAAGLGVQALDDKGPKIEPAAQACESGSCGCPSGACAPKTILGKLKSGMGYAFGDILSDVGIWFLAGVLLAGIITAVVPAGFIEENLGRGLIPMLIMLAASMPMYVCATSSTPIAAALVLKGLSPGAALVFLLAGPATNAASIAMVAKILGRRGTVVYLAAIALCSIGLGFLADALYGALGMDITAWAGGAEEAAGGFIAYASAILLTGLIVRAYVRERFGHADERVAEISGADIRMTEKPKF